MDNGLPVPPFPEPQNEMLQVLFQSAKNLLTIGEDIDSVLMNLAVNAWMEGHIEGHTCDGTEDEPGDVFVRRALWEGQPFKQARKHG